jgi:hypothetical protein
VHSRLAHSDQELPILSTEETELPGNPDVPPNPDDRFRPVAGARLTFLESASLGPYNIVVRCFASAELDIA